MNFRNYRSEAIFAAQSVSLVAVSVLMMMIFIVEFA